MDWKRHFSVSSLNNAIRTTVNNIGAKRIVIDPLSTLLFHYPDPEARRTAIMDLIRTLRGETDCTSLLVLDLRTADLERDKKHYKEENEEKGHERRHGFEHHFDPSLKLIFLHSALSLC